MSSVVNANDEFLLLDGTGDEYFELIDEDGDVVTGGHHLRVSFGDRIRVMFHATHQIAAEFAESGKEYTWEGIVCINNDGSLVLPNGTKHAATGELIEIYPQNGNAIRFGLISN